MMRPRVLIVLCASWVTAAAPPVTPDRVILHANIWTGDATHPHATAMAIAGDHIMAVGDDDAMRALAGATTKVEDAQGRRIVPGFHDAHWHLPTRRRADLTDAKNPAEIVARLRAFAATLSPTAWVLGRGWTPDMFPNNDATRRELDLAFPNRPVVLTDRDGHQSLVNGAALTLAKITPATPAPIGGAIVRDASGVATGLLKETAGGLVTRLLTEPDADEVYAALREQMHHAVALGLTALQVANGLSPAESAAFARAEREDSLLTRFRIAVPFERNTSDAALRRYVALRDAHRGPMLRYGIAKGMIDGTVDAASAAMLAPYCTGGGSGLPRWEASALNTTVARYDSAGLQVELHAIGDRAIRMALDAFAFAAQRNGPRDRRGRVEHVEVPDPADIPRFASLGVIASTQAIFATPDATTLNNYAPLLGPVRAARAMPFDAFDAASAAQAFGSDYPVFSMDPLLGIYIATTRMTPEGTPAGGWFPAHRISVEAALRHYTAGSAYAAFRERELGTLAPGMLADFVMLSDDILTGDPSGILRAKPVLTVVGGRDVYRAPSPRADKVLFNGRVLTVDGSDRVAQGVAIAGTTIVGVGTDAEVLALAAPDAERIDLHGRTVTPGLLDAHNHFAGGGMDEFLRLSVSYPAVKSITEMAAVVRARAATLPPEAWINGRGWDEGKLAERRLPTVRDLDAAAGGHPMVLEHTTGHYVVANSVALARAGITKSTPDPAGGTIDRFPDGTPTGELKENAQDLVWRLVPAPTRADQERGMAELAKAFSAEGMTGLKDPGISDEQFAAYQAVAARGELPVRVFALWSGGRSAAEAAEVIRRHQATTQPYQSTGDDHVIAGGVKLYIDGSGGARTAWMYDEWNTNVTGVDHGNRGYPTTNADTIRRLIRMYHDAGMHVSVHAIGDRAIDWVVDTYDQAMRDNPKPGLRHGIIHANVPTDHALDVMARLQHTVDAGYPEPSATFTWWIGDTYAGNFGARAARLNPFASYLRRGMTWANGSDFNVTPFPARYGIWAAVAREPLLGVHGGDPFGRAESVDVHAALRAVTIWAARQMFLERKIGSIEVGKYADLAVWDRDFYAVPTAQLKDARCLMTLFNGAIVYRAPGSGF